MIGLEQFFFDYGWPASLKKRIAHVAIVLALCAVLLGVGLADYLSDRRLEGWATTR